MSVWMNNGVEPRARHYLVHALRDKLPLAVDAGEGAVPCHLLQSVGDVSRRRRAAIRGVGADQRQHALLVGRPEARVVQLLVRWQQVHVGGGVLEK